MAGRKGKPAAQNWILAYYQSIKNGSETVGKWILLLYDYIVQGLEAKRFFFDQKKANTAINWIETHCFHTEGPLAPGHLTLELWQKAALACMFGIVDDRKLLRVYCKCDHITNDEVDDGFQLDLYFEGGLTARIEVGTSHFIAMPRFYMTGANGSAMINNWQENCRVVCCKNWDEKNVVPVVTAAGLTKTMAPRDSITVDEYDLEKPVSDVHDYYRNIHQAIDGKATQLVTHEQMRIDLKVIMCAFESVETGMTVKF